MRNMQMKNKITEIVEAIKENADEITNQDILNEVEYGTLLGYAEALSIIRDACTDMNLSEIGLDFDIDERYLFP